MSNFSELQKDLGYYSNRLDFTCNCCYANFIGKFFHICQRCQKTFCEKCYINKALTHCKTCAMCLCNICISTIKHTPSDCENYIQ